MTDQVVTWGEIRGLSGRIGRSSFLLRFTIPYGAAYSLLALLDLAIGQWHAGWHFGFLSAIFMTLSIYPWLTLSVKRLHDIDTSGWVVLILFVPFVNLLATAWLFAWPGTPRENAYGPPSASLFPSEPPNARVVSGAALIGGVVVILLHLIAARFVVPVFDNMFASVNVALTEPTRSVLELSRRGLLGCAFFLLDAAVLLLWFRYSRPTWSRLWLVLAAAFGVITISLVVIMYLPVFDMINATK